MVTPALSKVERRLIYIYMCVDAAWRSPLKHELLTLNVMASRPTVVFLLDNGLTTRQIMHFLFLPG